MSTVLQSASQVAVTMVEFHNCPRQEEDITNNTWSKFIHLRLTQIYFADNLKKLYIYMYTQGRENYLETHKT